MNTSSYLIFLLTLLTVKILLINSETAPVFIWSGEKYFPEKGQYLNTITDLDFEHLLKVSFGLPTNEESSLDPYLEKLKKNHPELVFIFLEPHHQTAEFAQLTSAYHKNPEESLSKFKNIFASSKSSLLIPYSRASSITQILFHLLPELNILSPSSSLFLVKNQYQEEELVLIPQISTVSPSQFLKIISGDSEIMTNNVVDVAIITFDSFSHLPQNEEYMEQVSQLVPKKEKYMAVFTAKQPETHLERITRYMPELNNAQGNSGSWNGYEDDEDTYTSYFPVWVIQVIFITALLLFIAFVGICCTCIMQTPQRFETPKQRRTEM